MVIEMEMEMEMVMLEEGIERTEGLRTLYALRFGMRWEGTWNELQVLF